jgi:hypothetical protein
MGGAEAAENNAGASAALRDALGVYVTAIDPGGAQEGAVDSSRDERRQYCVGRGIGQPE